MTRLGSLFAGLATLVPAFAAAAPHFAVIRSIALNGPVKWDYLVSEPKAAASSRHRATAST